MFKDDDFKLLRGFADGWKDRQTNGETFVIVELLLRLKKFPRVIELLTNFSYLLTC